MITFRHRVLVLVLAVLFGVMITLGQGIQHDRISLNQNSAIVQSYALSGSASKGQLLTLTGSTAIIGGVTYAQVTLITAASTTGVVGVAEASASNGQVISLAVLGQAPVQADRACTASYALIISPLTNGDAECTNSPSGQTIGYSTQTIAGSGLVSAVIDIGGTGGGGGGGGGSPVGNTGDLQTKANPTTFGASHINDTGSQLNATENVAMQGPRPYIDVTAPAYGAAGDGGAETTTGTIGATSNQLSVASATGFKVGMGVHVDGAGVSGDVLIAKINAIVGNTLTLSINASTMVSGAVVGDDDTLAIQGAMAAFCAGGNNAGGSIFFPPGQYVYSQPQSVNPSGVPFTLGCQSMHFLGGAATQEAAAFNQPPRVPIIGHCGPSMNAQPAFLATFPNGNNDTFENLVINGCNKAVYLNGSNVNRFINTTLAVGATGLTDNTPLHVSNLFWLWMQGGGVVTNSTTAIPSILFTADSGGGFTGDGLVYLSDMLTAGGPIEYIQRANRSGALSGQFVFRNINMESGATDFFQITNSGSFTSGFQLITMDNVTMEDNTNPASALININDAVTNVTGVIVLNSQASSNVAVKVTAGTLEHFWAPGGCSGNQCATIAVNSSGVPIGGQVIGNEQGVDVVSNAIGDIGNLLTNPVGVFGNNKGEGPAFRATQSGNSFASYLIDASSGFGFANKLLPGWTAQFSQSTSPNIDVSLAAALPPSSVAATPGGGGSLSAGTYYIWMVSTTVNNCTTAASNFSAPSQIAGPYTVGASGSLAVTWVAGTNEAGTITGYCIFGIAESSPAYSPSAGASAFISGVGTVAATVTSFPNAPGEFAVNYNLVQVSHFIPTGFTTLNLGLQAATFSQQGSAPALPGSGNDKVYFDASDDFICLAASGAGPCNIGSATHPLAGVYMSQANGCLQISSDLITSTGTPCGSGGGGGAVSSVFGRTGAVVAASNDYTLAQISATYSPPLVITGSTLSCPTCNTTTADVASVFGRTGVVLASNGDYTASQVTNAFNLATNNSIGVHYVDIGTQAAPANPSAGSIRVYANSGSGLLACVNSGGTSCMPPGAVTSVFGRTGAVTAQSGDYTLSQITSTISSPLVLSGSTLSCPTCAVGSFANTTLSNLGSTSINTDLVPDAGSHNIGSPTNPFVNLFFSGTVTNTSGNPWIWAGPEGSECGPSATAQDSIFIGDSATHSILFSYNGGPCSQVMLGTNPMTVHGVTLAEGNGQPMVSAAPSANSQCFQSASSNFATTDPSFQTCPNTFSTILTATNCSSNASPAVCGSAAAGSVAIPTGITSSTLQVNTSAVTTNSQILLYVDDTLGTKLGVTCNSTLATLVGGSFVSARSAGASFTITFNGTISTNPVCMSYLVVN